MIGMKKLRILVFMILLTSNLVLSQDYSGKGRIMGYVYDEVGNPLEAVKVKLFFVKTESGFETITDSEGKWKANWIRGGLWRVDFEKIGYEIKKIDIYVSSFNKNPPIEIRMRKLEGLILTDELKEDLIKANGLFEEEKYDEALRLYEEIIKKNPDAYVINTSIGNCYFRLKNYDQAEEFYLKVLTDDSENYDALLGIGNCYANRGENEKSLEWYSRIGFEKIDDPLLILEKSIEAQRKLITGFKGNKKCDMKKWEEANNPNMLACSLSGEPTIYPLLGDFFKECHIPIERLIVI